jgi:hypothetical protein
VTSGGSEGATRRQLRSGLRLGLGFGAFLVGGMLLGNGMERVVWSARGTHSILSADPIGWIELSVSGAALIYSASVWWQLFAAYALIGSGKALILMITGRAWGAPYGNLPRAESFAFLVFGIVTVVTSWRFIKHPVTVIDRLALTACLFCVMWRAETAEFAAFGPSLAVGLFFLLLAWAYGHTLKARTSTASRPGHGQHFGSHP